MSTALAIFLLCWMTQSVDCVFVPAAHVTEYVPEFGGINCMEPCDRTAYLEPIFYGTTAACGLGIEYGTRVYIESVGWRTCMDHGGAIDDDEVDVAVLPADYLQFGISGYHDVVWVMPPED